jgi:glycosyltransferase involved in cell wall biosynthesis
MTEIVNGVLQFNEISKNSKGGTELIAQRMVDHIDHSLLNKFRIIHSRVRELDEPSKNILVLHDLPEDPESSKLANATYRKNFRKIVAVSDWQMQRYHEVLGIPMSEMVVIENAIVPFDDNKIEHKWEDQAQTIKLIYHTTPHRGLELLVPVFAKLVEDGFNIHLDVFSSFALYGWEQRDQQYEKLFDICKQHPKITYHGAVDNQTIRNALENAHIFGYPCIWPETSCLAAIEAMDSRTHIVHPNIAGLPHTVIAGTKYQYHEDYNTHANIFYSALRSVIRDLRNLDQSQYNAITQLNYMQARFKHNIEVFKRKWESLLQALSS